MAVTDDEIKERAYKIWELWGMPNDLGEVIWEQARRELEFQAQIERLKLVHRYSKAWTAWRWLTSPGRIPISHVILPAFP